jgi:uncharacterized Zn finger protein (UPF0148 family)
MEGVELVGVAKVGEQNLAETCDVCGKPLGEENVSRCLICGRRFHMTWSIETTKSTASLARVAAIA